MSIIEKEYNSINFKEKSIPVFSSEVKVSILDILGENKVEVIGKDYKDCMCKSSTNAPEYFKECDKCNGKGIITLNKRVMTCNKCKGEKLIRVKHCYLCDNNSKVLMDSKIEIELKNSYKHLDKIELDNEEYKLVLTLNVYDKDDYYIKGNDVYYLRGINYSINDHKEKKSVVINTVKGKEFVKSEFKCKKEIVCLSNKGINDGDFYITFLNEVKEELKTTYTNVIIGKSGYVKKEELIKNVSLSAKDYIDLDSEDYIYIDNGVDEIICDNYLVKLNKLSKDNYFILNGDIACNINLDKDDLNTDRKVINLDEEKLTISYKKNLKEVEKVEAYTKLVLDKQGKKSKMIICVNPYFENVYKIRIKNNKNVVYVEDYKYYDNTLVETFKSSKYLENYIRLDKEDKIVVGNDLVLIERV